MHELSHIASLVGWPYFSFVRLCVCVQDLKCIGFQKDFWSWQEKKLAHELSEGVCDISCHIGKRKLWRLLVDNYVELLSSSNSLGIILSSGTQQGQVR